MSQTQLRLRAPFSVGSPRRIRVPRPLRPFLGLTATEGVARLLSFSFYVLAARALAPAGFGEVRYTITLALLAFGPMQVLVTAIQRELGAVRGLSGENEVIGTSLAITGTLWVLTIVTTMVLGFAGVTGVARPAGLAMVISGYAVFMTYYSIARGKGDIRRAAAAYAGGSLFQLIAFGTYLLVVSHPTPLTTLAVFSLSSALPVFVCELTSPVIRIKDLVLSGDVARQLWKLGLPLAAATCAFLIWQSADQIWVEQIFGGREVGLYGAAKNLSQLFIVLPMGVSGVLIPRMAELRQSNSHEEAARLLRRAAGVSFALSALVGIVVVLEGSEILHVVLGEEYVPAAGSLSILACAMVLYAPFSALVSAAVGWGRPGLYSTSITLAAAVEVGILAITGSHSVETAAQSSAISIACGLVAVMLILRARPLTMPEEDAGVQY